MIAVLRALGAALGFVPGWIWAAICAGLIATNCTTTIKLERERSAHQATRADHADAALAASETYRMRERSAAATLTSIHDKANHDKENLQRRVAHLTDSLRNRPERPAAGVDVPPGAADPVGCTGAQLYRSDAAVLVRLAGDADELRIDLQRCQAAYDAAVTLTN